MIEQISALKARALGELESAASAAALDAWQSRYLSRKGEAKLLLREVGKLAEPEARKAAGKEVNDLNQTLETALGARREELQRLERARRLESERVDVSLPSTFAAPGRIHPVNQVLREILRIFERMGFQVFESPHVETDELNFGLLNFPKHHPARDMQDTFFVNEDVVLRTHTSPGQIRAMRERAPRPLRVLLPGIVYRSETITPRSEIQFHQVEGLAVGPSIGLADLKGVLLEFIGQFFGSGRRMRLRGSYFPFTEPSVEVDIDCNLCAGRGCRLCKQAGWLEILGAGVVHPTVLQNGGYDPKEVNGFAFGIGIERMVLLRHGIDDIRYFLSGDLRFLEQFA
jgi:phenylalanyl-tRNA synthetase alpha chain